MKKYILIILLSIHSFAGQEVGNGGGFCQFPNLQFYMYDAIIKTKNPFVDRRQIMTYQQDLQFIYMQLKRLGEPMLPQFDSFISTLFTQKSGNLYQWFARPKIPLLWEPGLEPLLPAQCVARKQAILYFESPASFGGTIDIGYDAQLLSLVEKQPNGGLQLSYLFVHEWLWRFFDRSTYENMATFNRLLHSDKLQMMTVQDYATLRAQLFGPSVRNRR